MAEEPVDVEETELQGEQECQVALHQCFISLLLLKRSRGQEKKWHFGALRGGGGEHSHNLNCVIYLWLECSSCLLKNVNLEPTLRMKLRYLKCPLLHLVPSWDLDHTLRFHLNSLFTQHDLYSWPPTWFKQGECLLFLNLLINSSFIKEKS